MSTMAQEVLTQATKELTLNDKVKRLPKLMIGTIEFKFEVEPLDKDFLDRAAKELRETPENVEPALQMLRELIEAEPNFYVPTSREFLQRFLRPCKWYPKSAFELMKRFYKFRQSHPRYCANLTPSNERAVLMSGLLLPIPRRTADGVRVFLVEGGKKWKPKEISLDQIFRGVILFLEAAIAEPKSQVGGVRVILDMEGLALSQVTYFTPSFAAAVVDFVQSCLPCRLKGIHVVNQPFIFGMVFAFFKPFMQEKLRKRIHFHGSDREGLMKHIEAKALPKKYGGELDFPDQPIGEPFVNYIASFEDNFIETNKYGYSAKT
ncbi:alpha-tocopherol transfer protein-like [Copidosoma floridanum]|uniref:alpha-tocopherol transfer protein-like n=1 Tax=Copidosoma floridanum TaxID=29053 RepID=UPI0006C9AE90|nr:alpha-tocopherol transfer protein-like [Copidosoma floridanum]